MKDNQNLDNELHKEMCVLLQDIVDCLFSWDGFEEMYYLYMSTENLDKWKIRPKIIIPYLPRCIIETVEIKKNKKTFNITMHDMGKEKNTKTVFMVDLVQESVIQRELTETGLTASLKSFDGGIRINDEDLETLDEVMAWCEKINPNYW